MQQFLQEANLCEYFQNNPIPEGNEEELVYDLEEGGQYTVSGILDFGGNKIQLRCTNDQKRPTITYGEQGTIRTSAPLKLKSLNFNCSASANEAIGLSETPDESIKRRNRQRRLLQHNGYAAYHKL